MEEIEREISEWKRLNKKYYDAYRFQLIFGSEYGWKTEIAYWKLKDYENEHGFDGIAYF